MALAAELLVSTGLAADADDAARRLVATLDDGRAAEIFGRMVAALGGPLDFVDKAPTYLAQAPVVRDVLADRRVRRRDRRARSASPSSNWAVGGFCPPTGSIRRSATAISPGSARRSCAVPRSGASTRPTRRRPRPPLGA